MQRFLRFCSSVLCGALLAGLFGGWQAAPVQGQTVEPVKRVLLIGQKRDHPPGAHQYMAGLRVLARCLEPVPNLDVKLVQADEPWTEGPQTLRDIDAVVLYLGQGARWIQADPERFKRIQQLARGKTGFVAIHWAIGAQDARFITPYREIIGGIHGGPDRKYVIEQCPLKVVAPQHEIMRGVGNLSIQDEWYYQLKFTQSGLTPLCAAEIGGRDEVVGWALVRPGGGRSFGFSGMHYHENWRNESLRRLITQAVLWTLDRPIPAGGLAVDVPEATFELPPDE